MKKLSIPDLFFYMREQRSKSDTVMYYGLMALTALAGFVPPILNKWLFGKVLESGSARVLLALAGFMVSFSICELFIGTFQNFTNNRIGTKRNIAVQAAVMNRSLSLPTSFFRKYSSGELSHRASYVQSLCSTIMSSVGFTTLTSLFSLVYIGQIFAFAPSLAVPAIIITLITTAVTLVSSIFLYYFASKSKVSVADYYAFNASYGMISAAFASFASIASSLADIKPTLEMAKTIMEAEPEIADDKEILTSIRGNIELNNVSFRYDESMPDVIDGLSLKIKAGEYIAIVGATGCGKSTLMRLLLGFEKPQKGAIYYDGKDISRVDLKSLRRRIGTVMQDGRLFPGDIYSNIVIAAPELTLKDAWAAAETAAVADDIKAMPMGMHTVISEGQGGISGGQKQRLMIARAFAHEPKILMFDEATSALDNITQKKVTQAIDSLKCTRIVIAHRLSTIRESDRIIVLDKGKIAEEGTYDELINKRIFR